MSWSSALVRQMVALTSRVGASRRLFMLRSICEHLDVGRSRLFTGPVHVDSARSQ